MGNEEPIILRPDSVVVDADLTDPGGAAPEKVSGTAKPAPAGAATSPERNAAKALNMATEALNLVNQVARDAARHINELKGRTRLLEDVLCERTGMSRFELLEREGAIHLYRNILNYHGVNGVFPEIEFNQSITLTGKDFFKEEH